MKGFTLLMSLVAVLAAGVSGALFFKIDFDRALLLANNKSAQAQLAAAQQRATDQSNDRERMARELAATQDELAELKARNTTLEARNSQLSRELTRHREQLSTREQTEQGAQLEIANLRRQLADSRAALAASIGGATPEQVAAYEARIRDLEDQLLATRRTAPADPALADVPPGLSAEVIEVGPRSAFVVLNIGHRHGARVGLELQLHRAAQSLARIRITEVKENYCIATVLPETGAGNLRPGDVASRP